MATKKTHCIREKAMILLEYAADNPAALKMSVCIRVMLSLYVFSLRSQAVL